MTSPLRFCWVVSLTCVWHVQDYRILFLLFAVNYSIVFLSDKNTYKSIPFIVAASLLFSVIYYTFAWLLILLENYPIDPFESASLAGLRVVVSFAGLPLFINGTLLDDAIVTLSYIPAASSTNSPGKVQKSLRNVVIQTVVFITPLLSVPARFRSITLAQSLSGVLPWQAWKRTRLLLKRPAYFVWDVYTYPLLVRSIEAIPVITEGLTLKGFGDERTSSWKMPPVCLMTLMYFFGTLVNLYELLR